jgi:hypothetical protein
VGEHRQGDVGIPGAPGPDLVVIQPGFVLGLLETLLDAPPGPGDPGQVQQGRSAGSVANVVGDLGRIGDRTPGEQPVPAPGLVGARNSGTLRDLRIFVDHSAKSVMSDDLDVASFGVVQWS